MAAKLASRGPIRLRNDISDDEGITRSPLNSSDEDREANDGLSDGSSAASGSDAEDTDNDSQAPNEDDDASEEETSAQDTLKDITFGTLAEAQERFAPNPRKRKTPHHDTTTGASPAHPDNTTTKTTAPYTSPPKQSRQSKHAPTILSSRTQVSRTRTIFSPPPTSTQSRDPRFDATITSTTLTPQSQSTANKNYSFLTTYRTSEITALKSQLRHPSTLANPALQSQLRAQLASLESKIRNTDNKSREAAVLAEHNRQEKEKIRRGEKKRPYYLKQSEVRKAVQTEREAGMGKKEKERKEMRKRKREKTRDAKGMPRVRRG